MGSSLPNALLTHWRLLKLDANYSSVSDGILSPTIFAPELLWMAYAVLVKFR